MSRHRYNCGTTRSTPRSTSRPVKDQLSRHGVCWKLQGLQSTSLKKLRMEGGSWPHSDATQNANGSQTVSAPRSGEGIRAGVAREAVGRLANDCENCCELFGCTAKANKAKCPIYNARLDIAYLSEPAQRFKLSGRDFLQENPTVPAVCVGVDRQSRP